MTPDEVGPVAEGLSGPTAEALMNAHPVMDPYGRYVPGRSHNGYARYVAALARRGLVEPDPQGVWPALVTVDGLVVRDWLFHREAGALLELRRAVWPRDLRHIVAQGVDTHGGCG